MAIEKHCRSWETPYQINLERTADTLRNHLADVLSQQRLGGLGVNNEIAKAVHDYDKVRKDHL